MNRRSLLSLFGVSGAAAAGEAIAGPAWFYPGPPSQIPMAMTSGMMGRGGLMTGAGDTCAIGADAFAMLSHQERILQEAAAIESEQEYAMLDWGGAI